MSAKVRPSKGKPISGEGGQKSIRVQKLKRKQNILRQMSDQGASKQQVIDKANFMAMKPDDYVYLLRYVQED